MKSCRVCHGLVLLVDREELVNHEQDLASGDVELFSLSLRRLRLLYLLAQEMCISGDALHQRSEEDRVKANEVS